MLQFEFTDDGIFVSMSEGPGDLKAKIDYTKLPSVKDLPEKERIQLGTILEVVTARLRAELAMQANAVAFKKLQALQSPVVVPEEKKLIVPGG